ncbi:MAG: peroxidase family protein [Acidimicrobiales bacterium]
MNETGLGEYTVTSGLEGAWTPTPTKWTTLPRDPFGHEWELVKSPAGANQWQPKEVKEGFMVPPVQPGAPETKPTMSTADMAMITDPAYLEISKRFHENPDQLADAFAKAWFKAAPSRHGSSHSLPGPQVPTEEFLWQDNVPAHDGALIGDAEIAEPQVDDPRVRPLARSTHSGGLGPPTYRSTDFRGGANGARIRLSPMSEWDVNVASGVSGTISELAKVQADFNAKGGAQVSLADLIVLGGTAAVEAAAKAAGHDVTVPSRRDAPTPHRRRPTSSRSPGSSQRLTGSGQLRQEAGIGPDRAPSSTRRSC